jgi:hypothetical protein
LVGGFPKWLAHFQPYLDDTKGVKALLTLLTLTRAISLKPSLDISTIIDPWTGVDDITDREFSLAIRALKIHKGTVGEWAFPHMSTKRGPQGQAILSSLSELTLLPQQLIKDISLLGGSKLGNTIKENIEPLDILAFTASPKMLYHSVAEWWAHLFPTKSSSLRKLSYFADKEGKTRVIGICDYWTHSCLRPLHKTLNGFLRRIPSDCTFDQDRFSRLLPKIRLGNNRFHSIDLSSATDRMPISLQKRVISFLFASDEKADAWSRILVDYPFSTPSVPEGVVYGAGQPMGASSS